MNSNDMQEAALLLSVMHQTLNLPTLKGLHDIAMTELLNMQSDEPSHNDLKGQVQSLSASNTAQKSNVAALKEQVGQLQAQLASVTAERDKLREDINTPQSVPTPSIPEDASAERRV